jgi:hypothetical protein
MSHEDEIEVQRSDDEREATIEEMHAAQMQSVAANKVFAALEATGLKEMEILDLLVDAEFITEDEALEISVEHMKAIDAAMLQNAR